MNQPTIGVIISTPGRASLLRTLYSIAYQGAPIEDVLVVGDGYHMQTAELVREFASWTAYPCRYIATEKTRDWGHSQLNYALQHVRGDYVIVQDDDDIFLPRALTEAARLIRELDVPKPIIGRVKSPYRGLLWQKPGLDAVLDGHCLLVPNDKKKLGYFTSAYDGDQAYIHHTLRAYPEWAWTDRIWTLARPQWKLWAMGALQGEETWTCDLHYDEQGAPFDRCATVLLEKDETHDIFHATVDSPGATLAEYHEIAEFLMYAAQGMDLRVRVRPWQVDFELGLIEANYKEHIRTDEYVEFAHDWPPDFWTALPPFTETFDRFGQRVVDWRDNVWGRGKKVD